MNRFMSLLKTITPEPLLNLIRKPYHYTLAVLAACVYQFPARKLHVIGVTGTNGKSTTANLAAAILEAAGHTVGLITTVNFQIGDEKWPNETKMTSFGRFQTQKLLRRMVEAGCTHVVLEVSSHAMHQHRMWGIPFETAVFTNLSRDHLDYHPTMEAYRAAKGKLFAKLRAADGGETTAIINGDDAEAPYFLEFFADRKYLYGTERKAGELMPLAHSVIAEEIKSDNEGSRFTARAEDISLPIHVHIPGRFNVSNALAAICVGLVYRVDPKQISAAIDGVTGVPGRMERVEAGQPFPVIVDYAHTPDAFQNVLETLRPLTKGKLIIVFGATGDRDRGKRPELGRIAAALGDYLVLTEEDPGSEDALDIIEEVRPGIDAAGTDISYDVEPDRRKAIRMALTKAKSKDTVVLLGKGHETIMAYASGNRPWDDRTVATEEWRKLKR